LLVSVSGCKYCNIHISDHAPVCLNLKLDYEKGRCNWRLNNALLKDKEFCSYISNEIKLYLNSNDTGDVDDNAL
ncbi:hypothetical protein XENOCAPTIV_010916, partial [Xenoophorus captivus]